MSIIELCAAFCDIAKDLQKDFVEAWLNGDDTLYDLDMDKALENERHARAVTYQKIANELRNKKRVE